MYFLHLQILVHNETKFSFAMQQHAINTLLMDVILLEHFRASLVVSL